jgi:hypothetical protein
MHVLIAEPSDTTTEVEGRLKSAGHFVHRCSDDDAQAVCVALRGRPCPLDAEPVDVVIEVRSRSDVAGVSDGVRCARRRGLPTIVSGGEDVVDAAVAERDTPSPGRSSVATAALVDSLNRQGIAPEEVASARAIVTRRWGGMFVQVTAPSSVDAKAFGQAAIRIHQELRQVDPWARSVDIARRPPGQSD